MHPFQTDPVVYAVDRSYQIFLMAKEPMLVWVEIQGKDYYDHSNGIIRSASLLHKVEIPMPALDAAGEYTICWRVMLERKPYFSKTGEVQRATYSFRPVGEGEIRIYHIADAHNKVDTPVQAGRYFGDALDLLVLNGDIPNHSGRLENFDAIHRIAGEITHGGIPVVFSRGNHDTRGIYAECIADYTPTDRGVSYFTFRLGPLWGLVLDCGEDKVDTHPEYGNTVCCSYFREQETAFLKRVVERANTEYLEEGVTKRVVISHVPFAFNDADPFNIEVETYTEWARLIREHIHPQLHLCGHMHVNEIWYPGGEHDCKGQACPVIIGSDPHSEQMPERDRFDGCAILYSDHSAEVRFTNEQGETLSSHIIPFEA